MALKTELKLWREVPFRYNQTFGTHNSYNFVTFAPHLFWDWRNQYLTITQQLNLGARLIEIDVKRIWWTFGYDTGYHTVVCHGPGCFLNPNAIFKYVDVLSEIKAWMVSNPTEFIFLQIENQLVDFSDSQSQNKEHLEGPLRNIFGNWIYRSDESPKDFLSETPGQLVKREKRVAVATFPSTMRERFDVIDGRPAPVMIWDMNDWFGLYGEQKAGSFRLEERRGEHACFYDNRPMSNKIGEVSYFNDDKAFEYDKGVIDESNIGKILTCNVSCVRIDRYVASIRAAAHWTWANDATLVPGADYASLQVFDRRWRGFAPTERAVAALRSRRDHNVWTVTSTKMTWFEAVSMYADEFVFDVPRTYRQNVAVCEAALRVNETFVWLYYQENIPPYAPPPPPSPINHCPPGTINAGQRVPPSKKNMCCDLDPSEFFFCCAYPKQGACNKPKP